MQDSPSGISKETWEILRPSISGFVTLKRKDQWVRRYAKIDGSRRIFTYRKTEEDKPDKYQTEWKYQIDLSCAKVKKGMRNEKEPYIYIENKDCDQTVLRVSLESNQSFDKWFRIIRQALKSDEELAVQYKLNQGILNKFTEHKQRKLEIKSSALLS